MAATRVERLARAAAQVKDLPVATQFQILAAHGLTLRDTNWENWKNDPGKLETIIPVIVPRPAENKSG